MEIEHKTVELKIEDVDEEGTFEGYASTFGNIDLGYDVVEAGAFKKTIRKNKGIFPILDHHDPRLPVGWNESAMEDDTGLFVKGKLNLEVQAGKEKHALIKQAAKLKKSMGLSIGFRVIKYEIDQDDPRLRYLKELELIEYSVVMFPMNPAAGTTAVKMHAVDEATQAALVELAATARDALDAAALYDLKKVFEEG